MWIPKVFDGRNRLFFMTSWQSQRLTGLLTAGEVTVFTPLELQGNFSKSGPNGGPDPKVVQYLQQFPYFQPNPTLAAEGIIDPSKINPVSQNIIQAGLIPNTATGTLFQQGSTLNNNDELTERVDFVATDKDRISVTLHGYRQDQLNPNGLGNPYGTNGTYNNLFGGNRYLGSIAYTKTLSPSMVNEFRFSAQRNDIRQDFPGSKLPTDSALGVGLTPDQQTGPPILCFYDDGYCTGFSPNGPTQLINNTYIWSDTLSWQKGNHGLKMGFNYTPFQNNTTYDFYVDGDFDFYGQSGGGSFSQNDRADFLMGLPDDLYEAPRAPSNIRTHNIAGFFQDEWKSKEESDPDVGPALRIQLTETGYAGALLLLGYRPTVHGVSWRTSRNLISRRSAELPEAPTSRIRPTLRRASVLPGIQRAMAKPAFAAAAASSTTS